MLAWEIRSYQTARNLSKPVFFDRGVPDIVGYLRLQNLPIPSALKAAAETFRYNRRVFIVSPWEEIFQQDRERRQTFQEAVSTFEVMVDTYAASGYQLVEIPRAPVEERTRFVLAAAGLDILIV